jgi:hypothetical protein
MKKREEGKRKNWSKKVKKLPTIDGVLSLSIWKIFNIPLFSGDKCQVLKIISEKLDLGTKKYWIATVNPEFVMGAEKDSDFKINGIILNYAFINDTWVTINDVINEYKIIKIGKDFVLLRNEDSEIKLEIIDENSDKNFN